MTIRTFRKVVDTTSRTKPLRFANIGSRAASISTFSSYTSSLYALPIARQCRSYPITQQKRLFSFTNPFSSQQFPKTTYAISASFTAKDVRYSPLEDYFPFSPDAPIRAVRSDKNTRPASGQDSFFVSRIASTDDIALGIADGVGGWADSDVDPADFAHGFCDYMAYAAHNYDPSSWQKKKGKGEMEITARSLMQKGYEAICRDPAVPAGGSTACVALLSASGILQVANLGDSGFMQLRSNAIHAYSEPQTHAFNTPYQLSVVPEKVLQREANFGGQRICDMPADAHVSQNEVRHGDVLVFASDGVWDNLSRQDILKIVSRIMLATGAWEHTASGVTVGSVLSSVIAPDAPEPEPESEPRASGFSQTSKRPTPEEMKTSENKQQINLQDYLAIGITSNSKSASMDTKRDGPFAKEVQKYYPGDNWRGGKVDDICVVVAVVCETGK